MRPSNVLLGLIVIAASAGTLAAGSGLGGCGRSSTGSETPASGDTPSQDDATLALLDEAASDALVAVVVRPERWAGFRDALAPSLSEPARELVGKATSVWELLAAAGLPLTPGDVPSLDERRPIALGLMVVAAGDALRAAASFAGLPNEAPLALRHRALLPARDADKLANEVKALCVKLGVPLAQDRRGGTFVSLHPEGDRLRVEVVSEGDAFDAETAKAWQTLLAARPAAKLEATAGAARAAAPDAFLSALVQTQRLRTTHAALGAITIMAAVGSADPQVTAILRKVGLAEVLSGWTLLAPERALTHDIGSALDVRDGAVNVSTVVSLTARGLALVRAGEAGAKPLVAPSDGWARVSLALSPKAIVDAVEVPPSLAGLDEAGIARLFMECGSMCNLSGHGLAAMLAHVVKRADPELRGALPRSAAFVAKPSAGEAMAYALALGFAADEPGEATLARLRRDVPDGVSVSAQAVDGGGGARVTIVHGIDPAAAFTAGEAGPLLTYEVDLGVLAGMVLRRGDGVLSGRVHTRVDRSGAALVSTARLVRDAGAKPTLVPDDLSRFAAPASAPALTKGTTCLEQAVALVASGWKSEADVEPAQARLVAMRAAADAMVPLACARADEGTHAAADLLARIGEVIAPTPKPTP